MSYKRRSTFQSENAGRYVPGVKKWDPQEQEEHLLNFSESVAWNEPEDTLTDGATITWDFSTGDEKVVTLGGNRTLSITNLPTDHVVHGELKVIQDGTGGRTLTLPSGRKNGSINTAAGSHSIVTFRYNGTSFDFAIGQFS